MQPPPERLEALTGLRFFAALAVLLHHLGPARDAGVLTRTALSSGYCGVTIFFVLSGFVLGHNYFDRFAAGLRRGDLWSFAVARFARIYPLYLLLLVWSSLPRLFVPGRDDSAWWLHLAGLQAWSPDVEVALGYNGPAWSISVELFLYAAFPLLVPLLAPVARRPRGALAGLVVVTALLAAVTAWFVATGRGALPSADPGSAHRWLYRTPALRLGDFALGILCARLALGLRPPGAPERPGLARWATTIALAVMAAVSCVPSHVLSAPSFDLSYAAPTAALLVGLAVAPASRLSRWLAAPTLVLLGEASYALYLSQFLVVDALLGRWVSASTWTWLLAQATAVVVASSLAIGLHVAIERPARRWLRARLDPAPRA